MSGAHWLWVFGGILFAWLALFAMAIPQDMLQAGNGFDASFWVELCSITPDAAGFIKLTIMWGLMSGAMMAPTFLPALTTYEDLPVSTRQGFYELLAGYLIVWLMFSIIAAAGQMGLSSWGLLSPFGQSLSTPLTIILLLIAGLYQFSTFKDACLSKCRMPLTYFMERWNTDRWNALSLGLGLGVVCLGCCWALMLLAFVGGTMNIAWMGLATVFMVFEKLPEIGRWITRPLGVVLVGWAMFLMGQALAAPLGL
ncbi:DUF2182 domain-containing protein [Cochlodiniinecator piscidefendens]|uniref:DUF2182 domain-containing protein n=1 Tax=Cochlodiniinecator piscidefendens TaxID=2715756 RepID=UPI00140808CC|nr:DUF2182 domain-containing protein [Cochlodiniinecator piscidefendens]